MLPSYPQPGREFQLLRISLQLIQSHHWHRYSPWLTDSRCWWHFYMIMNIFEGISHLNLDSPDFANTTKVHDWRNHVPDEFIERWGELTERERKIIAVMAEGIASSEEWD